MGKRQKDSTPSTRVPPPLSSSNYSVAPESSVYYDANEASASLLVNPFKHKNNDSKANLLFNGHTAWGGEPVSVGQILEMNDTMTSAQNTVAPSTTNVTTTQDEEEDNNEEPSNTDINDGMINSYMWHLKNQANRTKKWLNDVNIEQYLKIPESWKQNYYSLSVSSSNSNGTFALKKGSGNFNDKRLSMLKEELSKETLSMDRKMALFPVIFPSNSCLPKKDQLFAWLFIGLCSLMFVLGILSLFLIHYPNDYKVNPIIKKGPLFVVLMDSSWILLAAAILGTLISMAWTFLMKRAATPAVWGMVIFPPLSSGLLGSWILLQFIRGGQSWLLLPLSVIFICLAFMSGHWLRRHLDNLNDTIEVIRMASEILRNNPGIYVFSMILLLGYIAFVIIWITFFTRALLMGYYAYSTGHGATFWYPPWIAYFYQAFLVLMLIWISMIFTLIQKGMIGGVVGRWYFSSSEIEKDENIDHHQMMSGKQEIVAWNSLKVSILGFFGQICFAAILLTIVRIFNITMNAYHWLLVKRIDTNNGGTSLLTTMIRNINLFISFMERLFEHLTDLSIYLISLTGESYWTASRNTLKIFRRNLLTGFTTDLFASTLFTLGDGVMAAALGTLTYWWGIKVGVAAFRASILFGMLLWFVLRFFSGIFRDTIDATFMCFAIDLDTQKMHHPLIHDTFNHRIIEERV